MSGSSRIGTDFYVDGNLSAKTMSIPTGTVADDDVKVGAGIKASKFQHRHHFTYRQDDGADIVAATVPLALIHGATAVVEAVKVTVLDAPSDSNEGFTVDLQVADQGTPTPASILDDPITYNDAQDDCAVIEGTITDADRVQGDILILVIALLGATGTKGQGLLSEVVITEDAA